MQKYDYRVYEIRNSPEREINRYVAMGLKEVQDAGWEYVSGPTLTSSDDYLFLLRRKQDGETAYNENYGEWYK